MRAAVQQFDHSIGGLLPISGAQHREHFGAGFGIEQARGPTGTDFVRKRIIAAAGTIRLGIAFCRIPLLVFQQGVGEGSQHRFGMMPTDRLQRAPTVSHVNGLVPDVPEITGAVAAKPVEDFLRSRRLGQSRDSYIGTGGVPLIHGFGKGLAGFGGVRHGFLIHRAHGPVALGDIAGLGRFKLIHGPEQGQPAVAVRGILRGEVGGMHDQNGVEFKAHWPGLNVADAREHQRCEDIAVRRDPALNPRPHFLQQAFARGFLQQPDQRFDVR